ncbi:Ubiquitin-conjugating enzyme E2 J1 [Daldinia childiae]|uniref:Ubiquitin-conjugating enzyme E2 J1 n=1 Tax=Daldinia childiae TaxID=326645 RepID=UPI001444B769|nr:Ubiquitin-conjugating enzyme E2 J1 [Daldinia childiae]KAF3056209.1 Ubiquitin-conjugating enzyme E2 J1 [Daldinia childiae]
MATSTFNSKSPTIRRILKEAAELSTSPSPDYTAAPLESDLFEWHFTLRGPPKSAFAEGIYHGRIVLPPAYPHRPPSFRFTTPSGRFEANREICLSISGHHEESWQPAWGVRTALVALRTFMETDARGQLGGLDTNDAVRRKLAVESRAWRCPVCARTNAEIIAECEQRCAEAEAENDGKRKEEIEIPAELKMGFRDEMEKARAAANSEGEKEDAESAELAEGFVQTVPRREDPPPALRPAQGVPTPTRTIPLPAAVGQSASLQTSRRVDPNAGVPPWVDYAIVSLVVILIAMLTKIIIGH